MMAKVLASSLRQVAQIAPEVGGPTDLAQDPGRVLVAGNGPRVLRPERSSEVVVAFNAKIEQGAELSQVVASTAMDVTNGSYALALHSTRQELAPWLARLQQIAATKLAEQAATLGCIPSTGFMVVHALWASRSHVRVDGLSLDPTITRPADLPSRKPMPQMFHNWLGERRLCLSRWLSATPNRWIWPLTCGAADPPLANLRGARAVAYRHVLSELLEARRSGCVGPLHNLAEFEIEPSHDLLRGSSETRKLEACFYLLRGQRDTQNWWLFDHEASAVVNKLVKQLRVAQTQTFRLCLQDAARAAERAMS